jgi:hypothetical protein
MQFKSIRRFLRGRWRQGPRALWVGALLLLLVAPAGAVDLSGKGYRLNLDTTVSWGVNYRTEDPDPRIIGLANGGTAYSVNGDDGNLNFDTGLVSNALKATVELDFQYKNFGFFVRGFGFYDYEVEENCCVRTQLTDDALERVGSRAELRDAFVFLKFNLGNAPGEIRVGEQVLSWGESTFIQGGINTINPVDVSALRVPGAEIRDALLPVGLVWASISPTVALTLEGFYQYRWEEVIIDPPGSYFSTNDFAGRGGKWVMLGFGEPSAIDPFPPWLTSTSDRPFLGVPRAPDREPDDDGQYGVALRWFAEGLANTEFGLFYMNYHSRLPYVNGTAGTLQGALLAQQQAMATYAFFGVMPGMSPTVDRLATAAGTDGFASTANYFITYPEDIKLYGLSWNAQLGTTGIAFQGEVAYRQDMPLLADDVELLFAALSPINQGLAMLNQVAPGGVPFGAEIPGYRYFDTTQVQFTLTKVMSRVLGADQLTLLFEGAYDYVSGFPDKSVLRMEGPGTYTSGNPIMAMPGGAHAGKPAEPWERFADAESWGYRVVGKLDYLNAIGAWNIVPRFGWQHDVDGVSPAPGGNFIEGLNVLSLGLEFNYQNQWQFDVSYTQYNGAGRYNLTNDRDFIAAFAKYSF